MSYRRSWSKTFEPEEFTVEKPPLPYVNAPVICPIHDDCFRAEHRAWQGRCGGMWTLKTPIDIQAVMQGNNHKILDVNALCMKRGSLGWVGGVFSARLYLIADIATVFDEILDSAQDAWRENKFKDLAIDISGNRILGLSLWQDVLYGLPSTYLDMHVANIKVDCEYYSDVPPVTATVKLTVVNTKSGALVKNAYVALMSGARIVADGYTDGGEVIFENIDEGSYTINVLAGGYYSFETSIIVEPPSVWYEIKIVPIPTVPLPDWVKYAVVGLGALGAIVIIPSVIRKKEKPIIVVK